MRLSSDGLGLPDRENGSPDCSGEVQPNLLDDGVDRFSVPSTRGVYLVHEAQPNAFATPGGYIYVVDALLYFAKNKEELAGTLCHEIAHTLHHDSMTLLEKEKRLRWREVGGVILVGPTRAYILAIALLGKLHSLLYSREAESRADVTGADVCAAAGSNPWGLVWLFQEFKDARTTEIPPILSDHPNDQHRIDTLQRHFKSDSATFGRFDANLQSATPLETPREPRRCSWADRPAGVGLALLKMLPPMFVH